MSEQRTKAARLKTLRAKLVEKQERIEELQQRRDDLRQEREHVARQYAEALVPHSILDVDDLTDRFSLSALREKVDALDVERDAATLAEAEPAIQSGAARTERAALSDEERERVAELEARLEDLPDRDNPMIRHERERIEEELADLRGGERQ